MAPIGGQFIVERRRLAPPLPAVGQTRYMLKVIPWIGPLPGDALYRFQNTVPRRQADNAVASKSDYIGKEGTADIWMCGRWQVSALDATHMTLIRVA